MEDIANHSENIETPVTEVTEHIVQPEGEAPPQEQPKGINVKYNKEERFVPEDEVPNWVQKGLNYDKVSEKAQQAERYQASLDRAARYHGFDDHEAYLSAIEAAEESDRIAAEAARLGVPEDVIREYVEPLKTKLDQYEKRDLERSEAEAMKLVEEQLSTMAADTVRYPDFAQHQDAVINLAASNGLTLDHAYKILTYDTRVTTASQQAQQEAIRKLQQNADSFTGSLGADAPDAATGYLGMSPAERKAFRERNKRGEPQQ